MLTLTRAQGSSPGTPVHKLRTSTSSTRMKSSWLRTEPWCTSNSRFLTVLTINPHTAPGSVLHALDDTHIPFGHTQAPQGTPVCYISLCIYQFIYWKSGTSDHLVLMLLVLQCTDYKWNFLTLTLTPQELSWCMIEGFLKVIKSKIKPFVSSGDVLLLLLVDNEDGINGASNRHKDNLRLVNAHNLTARGI